MSSLTVITSRGSAAHTYADGSNLLELLRALGYAAGAPCGGNGKCGKCRVTLMTAEGTKEVLACQTEIAGDCAVRLCEDTEASVGRLAPAQLRQGAADASLPLAADAKKPPAALGAAVDLGTTTVWVRLCELETGRVLGTECRRNPQASYGADVITRIGYCMEHADGLARLRDLIRAEIEDAVKNLMRRAGAEEGSLKEGFVAGNTVMELILAGIDPRSVAAAPYLPKTYFDGDESVELCGVPFWLSPCISGYVGGDITAGLLACGQGTIAATGSDEDIFARERGTVDAGDEWVLFLDAGTNGELVLYGPNGCTCCAVACGPAFEGAGIGCGMPAVTGAVDSVTLTEEGLAYTVIGGGEAKGLCGSGLIGLAACLYELGYIDGSGVLEAEGDGAFYLTDAVYLTQADVRALQLAKAAVAAGIRRLTEASGIPYERIQRLCLAGGFGTAVDAASAVKIGMLPQTLAEVIRLVGNTALAGATEALLHPQKRQRLGKIKSVCGYRELSGDGAFNARFVDAMEFGPKE